MKKYLFSIAFSLLTALATAQQVTPIVTATAAPADPKVAAADQRARTREEQAKVQTIARSEQEGIMVRVKDIAHFKGVTPNQLQGIGLVVGLNGTGDTQNSPFTAQLLANAMIDVTSLPPGQLNPKNTAIVSVTAELPPFSSPGNRIDIGVQSMFDATSLQGGYLLRTTLYGPMGKEGGVIAAAMGPVSIGGFNVSKSGSSFQKNHTTTGRLPEVGIVVRGIDTQLVFDGKMYLELNNEDFTSAQRLADQVNREHPEFNAIPIDAGTVQLTLPGGMNQVQAMSQIEEIHFRADTPATVVISENTGTVVMGGNVRIGPAVVAKGSLTVRIEQNLIISQPEAFSNGQTVVAPVATVNAKEDPAQVTEMGPTTSVADLAMIFGALKVSATDIIAILEALRDQGALKATLKIQ